MPIQIPLIRIFLSSPGDVGEERRLAQQVIKDLPSRHIFRDKLKLAVIAWDDLASSTPMEASLTPQQAIDKGLPQPAECDITIVVFWSRIGTPLTGSDGQPYESGTHWELVNALNSPSRTYIYHRTQEPSLGKINDPKYDEKLTQYRRLQAFLKSDLFFAEDGRIIRNILQYDVPSAFGERFALDLEKILLDILGELETGKTERTEPKLPITPNITVAETQIWPPDKSPFPGLRAFDEDDAPIFFGRGRETDSLVQLVKNHRFVAVVGASGSGKSSLVGAGLIPRLCENAIADENTGSKAWTIIHLKPNHNPFEGLYNGLIQAFPALQPHTLEAARIKKNFLDDMRETPEVLLNICSKALEDAPAWAEVMLFIDQFEELFTLTDEHLREPFVKMLAAIATSERFRAVVTMRHDFYPKAIELPELATLLNTSLNLPAPKRDALREMIERPAERAELRLEADLVKRILDDTGDEPGNLALMAYALDELYKLDDDRLLSHAEYEQLGGVQGAIGTRAENSFSALGLDESVIQQVFHVLVEVDERGIATRNRANFRPDNEAADVRELINAFTDARLLTTDYDESSGVATVEVAHEAILRQWKRLADWIEETQDDHRTISRTKRDARNWHERVEKALKDALDSEASIDESEIVKSFDYLRYNAEALQEFQEACKRLGVIVDDPIVIDFTEPEQERLYRELEDINTNHQRRLAIGVRLSDIGDTRKGIGLLENGLPDIEWLPVEGSKGKFKFEFGEFEVPNFFIAQYLTTYIQFQAFIESGEYDNPHWWEGFPKQYQPQRAGNATNGNANAPRDKVSWYQSVAFGRWINHKFQGLSLPHPSGLLVVGQNAEVRIPTEWEWQWAAQNGEVAHQYPWGERDDKPRANTTDAGINDRSTAVGMYPHGVAQCRALDMIGNLWEWCMNEHQNPEQVQVNDRNNSRLLRGGSFSNLMAFVSAAYRSPYSPYLDRNDYGFRLVVTVPINALSIKR